MVSTCEFYPVVGSETVQVETNEGPLLGPIN